MSIILKGSAHTVLPSEHRDKVLKLYIHEHRDKTFIRNYKYVAQSGKVYLPLNRDKLALVASILGEEIVDLRSNGGELKDSFTLSSSFKFRSHQPTPASQLLYHCIDKNYGVLSAGCGNGKTVVMTWVAGKLSKKTLILVDMGSLVSQWQEAFQMVWNKDVQLIDRDTKQFGDVCIATFQLLHLNPELVLSLREEFGCLLLDEFHSTASETRREILFKLSNKYRIGCTATLMKKGYSDQVLTDFVSGISVTMKDENALVPEVEFVETGCSWYSSDPSEWGKIQSKLAMDESRNRQVALLIVKAARQGRKILVVGVNIKSLTYIAILLKKFPECKVTVYIGSTTLKQDLALKEQIASGEVNVVLSCKKVLKGWDAPSLDTLILALPANNEAFITQVAGRIVRPVEGKATPVLIDLVDKGSLAKRFSQNRAKWYSKLKYTFKEVDV